MIVYLSGKMTGLEDMGRGYFKEKTKEYEHKGNIVINPGILPLGLKGESYMPICLAMLDAADAVVMLDGWDGSAGANLEKDYAIYNGKGVYDDTRKNWIYLPVDWSGDVDI